MRYVFLINSGWCREPLICRAFLYGILFYTSTNFCWCREPLICRTLMFRTLIFVRLICRYALIIQVLWRLIDELDNPGALASDRWISLAPIQHLLKPLSRVKIASNCGLRSPPPPHYDFPPKIYSSAQYCTLQMLTTGAPGGLIELISALVRWPDYRIRITILFNTQHCIPYTVDRKPLERPPMLVNSRPQFGRLAMLPNWVQE